MCPVQIDYSCRLVAFEWFILEIKFQRIGLLLANLPTSKENRSLFECSGGAPIWSTIVFSPSVDYFGPPNGTTTVAGLAPSCFGLHSPSSPRVCTGPGVRFFYLTEDDDEDLLTDEDAMSQDEEEVFCSSWSGSSEGGEFPNLREPKEKRVQSTKGSGYQSGSVPRRL
ncbi:hypothetical protein RDI58_010624 [Solanum bulbocastanum]|uniref:Uncharacterized protein n=1 Tax=Solanum bulbocastanum TaxID=147425 RepID=A0AAN8TV52_SOLBU